MTKKNSNDNLESGLSTVVRNLQANAEVRVGQLEMLHQVDATIKNGNCSVIKAGTGTGKSFAYLIPSILSGRKVVIATATKTLQDQLANNDLPLILKSFMLEIPYAVLKGRSNYLCRKSFEEQVLPSGSSGKLFSYTPSNYFSIYNKISEWLTFTEAGDLAELDIEITTDLAKRISVTADECIGARRCPKGDICFAEKARKKAENAQIIISNLHLLCLDIAHGKVLPDYEVLVVDEVHELEDIMTTTLGFTITSRRFRNAISELHTASDEIRDLFDYDHNLPANPLPEDRDPSAYLKVILPMLSEELPELVSTFDAYLKLFIGSRILHENVTENEVNFIAHLETMAERFKFLLNFFMQYINGFFSSSAASDDDLEETPSLAAMHNTDTYGSESPKLPDKAVRATQIVTKLLADIKHILTQDDNFVIYVESEAGFLKLEGMPLDLSRFLPEDTFICRPTIMTSATVDVGFTSRLGMPQDKVTSVEVQSPFDYKSNSLLYIPSHLPDPRKKDLNELKYMEIAKLLKAFQGKALVLFTSKSAMEEAYAFCLPEVSTDLIVQGSYSRTFLIDKFREERDTSLFATMSFWQGVDVPGESLSLVIIDKIPFPRPDDPLLMARRQLAGDAGFMVVDLPKAANLLAQGVGRLIRRSTDRGLIAILDPRLNTAKYKTYLTNSLPAMPITTDYENVLSYLATLSLNDN
ncbi:MAG: ATP-dependent DNA helicase [Firmicutes bacterium]|jgi:ATP-dependent DNA helicase DinG|nr:ATP-dependent DNA helicase [Bacillota bacterium]